MAANEKVGYDRAFMIGLIKEGNLQGKPHSDLEKMRAKERYLSTRRYFQGG